MTDKPTHRRGKAVDEAILAATVATIAATGTASISIDQVAEEAGVNKTTIYRRWPNVGELVLAAVGSQASTAIPIPSTGNLATDLTELCHLVRANISSPLGRALLGAARDDQPALAELRQRFWTERLEAAAAILAEATERGDCSQVDDPAFLIEQLVAPIHFRITEQQRTFTDDDIALVVTRLLDEVDRPASGHAPSVSGHEPPLST